VSLPVRIVLADAHPLVRVGFRTLAKEWGDIQLVGEAETGEQAVDQFTRHKPDVLVLDMAIPGIGGMETIHKVMGREPKARILILSFHENAILADRALRDGVFGYISKRSPPENFHRAVMQIAQGRKYIDAEIAQEIALQQVTGGTKPFMNLTEREFTVFLLLAEGRSTAEVSKALHLSPNTINTHYHHIKNKLGVSSKAEMTRIAIRHNLFEA
jgi:two-component system invasion response regulator UvrY